MLYIFIVPQLYNFFKKNFYFSIKNVRKKQSPNLYSLHKRLSVLDKQTKCFENIKHNNQRIVRKAILVYGFCDILAPGISVKQLYLRDDSGPIFSLLTIKSPNSL